MSDVPAQDTIDRSDSVPNGPASDSVRERISNRGFAEWYARRQVETNILEGKSYFNGPSPPKPPERHTPTRLLQCHRKATYARQNAPREGPSPEGLFWFGSEFEERVVVPYLRDVVPEDLYVQNSVWVDATVPVDGIDLHVRGSTDPAIVTEDTDPVVVTEIKTTASLDHLSEPKAHHVAQLYAYLYALGEESDGTVPDGLLVYASRKTFDTKPFPVTFDSTVWETVVEWMRTQTAYERDGALPPADPETSWECDYCAFKHRCGRADTPYSDIGPRGLLPLFDGYDRQNLVEYLDAHADDGGKLTPTLARTHPDLTDTYEVSDWSCPRCGETYGWNGVDWDGNTSNPPKCPDCLTAGELCTLSGPAPPG